MIKLVIADGNEATLESLSKAIHAHSDIEIVGKTNNGNELLELIDSYHPEIVITDIVLPQLDGLSVLKKIKENSKYLSLKTIVTSSFANDESIKNAAELGASYFYIKPFNIEDVIIKIKELHQSNQYKTGQYEKLENRIAEIVQKLGVPPHIKGYAYIRESIKMIYENPEVLDKITKVLYPTIAEKFKTTPTRVERAIRHAVQVAWLTKQDNETIEKMFSILHKDKPTNSQFVATIVERLRTGE